MQKKNLVVAIKKKMSSFRPKFFCELFLQCIQIHQFVRNYHEKNPRGTNFL